MPSTMFLTMVLCFALSISVAVSIGLASLVGAWQANLNLLAIVKEMFGAINKFPLAAIPFFILAGNLMESGGISQRLVEFAKSIVGGLQGGLAATCVLTCMIFAAVSGSSVATTFAIGAILIPALIKHGYPDELRRRVAGGLRRARRHHSAVDPDDPLRRFGGGVDRRALHLGLRPGAPDRRRTDGVRHRLRADQGLRQGRPRRADGRCSPRRGTPRWRC